MKHIIACLIFFAFASCTKMDANYAGFIKNGPIIYPGKADSVKAFAGYGRVMLSWMLTSDQTITGCKVFWNFGADSLVVPVVKTVKTDTIKVYINNLSEGAYNFTVYTYDAAGNRSVGSQSIGNIYGPVFMSTLFNRPVRSVSKVMDSVKITWVGRDARCLGTEWNFTGTNQEPGHYFSPVGDTSLITSCDIKQGVSYRSLFVPEVNAIDTFYTDYKTL